MGDSAPLKTLRFTGVSARKYEPSSKLESSEENLLKYGAGEVVLNGALGE